MTAWNVGRGPHSDLAIGVPDWYLFGRIRAGLVRVLYGWQQAHLQKQDAVEDYDEFGAALY